MQHPLKVVQGNLNLELSACAMVPLARLSISRDGGDGSQLVVQIVRAAGTRPLQIHACSWRRHLNIA